MRARAVDGKANEAVVAALAEAFDLRPGDVAITSGNRSRDKTVELTGNDEALRSSARKLMDS